MGEADERGKPQETAKDESPLVHSQVIDLLVANVIPTTKYFESRFDFLQHQVDQLREGQRHLEDTMNRRFEQADANLLDFKNDVAKRFEQVDKRFEQVDKRFEQVDRRFEQIDKRFEQMVAAIDRLTDRIEHRDEHQRNFTLRMFTISVTLSFLGVLGVLLKIFGII